MSKIKNIFDWLEEITYKKSSPNLFSEEDWEKWNSYMIHRFLSMNPDYIHLVNHVQTINPQEKRQIYYIYKELIPKKKIWLKYIKNQNKELKKEFLEKVATYFECSLKEAKEYIKLISEKDIQNILLSMGLDDKEIKKLKNG